MCGGRQREEGFSEWRKWLGLELFHFPWVYIHLFFSKFVKQVFFLLVDWLGLLLPMTQYWWRARTTSKCCWSSPVDAGLISDGRGTYGGFFLARKKSPRSSSLMLKSYSCRSRGLSWSLLAFVIIGSIGRGRRLLLGRRRNFMSIFRRMMYMMLADR